MKAKQTPSQEQLREIFDYVDGELIWKVARSNATKVGQSAGGSSCGYCRIFVLGARHMRHRLVWAWHHGSPGALEVDHINNVRGDDRIENLQLLDARANTSKDKGRSLPTGVYERGGRFYAQMRAGTGRVHCGTFSTPQAAAIAYKQALSQFEQTQPRI